MWGRTTLSARPDNAALCRAGPACPVGAVEKRIPRSRLCRDLGDGGYGCPCCGAQNFCAALRRTLEILTAATRSPRFLCHWQRSVRSPHRPAAPATKRSVGAGFYPARGRGRAPPLRTARYAFVGVGLPDDPFYLTPCKGRGASRTPPPTKSYR